MSRIDTSVRLAHNFKYEQVFLFKQWIKAAAAERKIDVKTDYSQSRTIVTVEDPVFVAEPVEDSAHVARLSLFEVDRVTNSPFVDCSIQLFTGKFRPLVTPF